ncbi:hypothetical protein ACLQ3K_06515 [Tsukamurella sp. DT100]|uniref:hypothetical protein n=1 Tax=Tsukamurella sp. DT100 TaxID=3393415 RepID=UPI003CEBA7AB
MRFNRGVFADPPVPLTANQEQAAKLAARSAARESRRTLRTARGQYRRYRDAMGAVYLDWPRWHAEYLKEYRGSSTGTPDGLGMASFPPYGS